MSDVNPDSCDIEDLIQMFNPMIRYYFKENPETLSDEEFAMRVKELKWLADEGFLRGKAI